MNGVPNIHLLSIWFHNTIKNCTRSLNSCNKFNKIQEHIKDMHNLEKKLNRNQTLYLAILFLRATRSSACRRCCSVPRAPPPLSRDDLQLLAGGAVVSQSPPLPGAALLARTALNSRPGRTLDVGFRATDALAIGHQEVIRDRLRRDHDYRAHDVDRHLKKISCVRYK